MQGNIDRLINVVQSIEPRDNGVKVCYFLCHNKKSIIRFVVFDTVSHNDRLL